MITSESHDLSHGLMDHMSNGESHDLSHGLMDHMINGGSHDQWWVT